MKKKWTFIGIGIAILVLTGYWLNGRSRLSCENCPQKELPFFQVFSAPTMDSQARQRKFLSFTRQSYPLFRVAVTAEEAVYLDVQAIMEKFPERFAKLPDGCNSQERFYRWIHSIPSTDIIVLFPSHQSLDSVALDRLKTLYSGTAAWLAFQGNIKHWARKGVLTGYAHLFQKIKLQEFLQQGIFSEKCKPENRLFELAGRHARRLRGNIVEGKSYGYSWITRSRRPYPRFRPNQKIPIPQSDLIIFSFDRPLHLCALLESVHQFVTSLNQIAVVYRVSSPAFEKGYEIVKKQFPHVLYLKQGDQPEKDFKPLFLQATFESPSPYVMFTADDRMVTDSIDLQEGILQMEQTGALGVYYRLGCHADFSYTRNQPQSIPPSIRLDNNMWAWQFSAAEGDWKYPHTIDMALYRKEDIKKLLTHLNYTYPNSLQNRWALKARTGGIGIYYSTSKVINIPLNMVSSPDHLNMSQYTPEELLTMFLGGLKLDIKPFQGYVNQSAHRDMPVNFISQDGTKR